MDRRDWSHTFFKQVAFGAQRSASDMTTVSRNGSIGELLAKVVA